MTTKDKQTQKALVPQKAIVSYQGRQITITFEDVKNSICPKCTDQEAIFFLKMAQSLNLNPWERDIFMVKYKEDEPASYIVASQAYMKGAETCPEFDGAEAGIVIKDSTGKLEFREGALFLQEEANKLVGGWAKVYRKDRQRPFYMAVNLAECQKYTRDGKPTRFWREMPATMVRKVALSRALREAFPTRLGGMVTDAEFDEIPEDTFPPALEKNGGPNWKMFYAKIRSELDLTPEQAHELLNVQSFKDLLSSGWTMEDIWNTLVSRLQEQGKVDQNVDPEQRAEVNPETGEILVPPEEEGEFGGFDEEPAPEPPAPRHERLAADKVKRDPATITSLPELFKACYEDFKLQPKDVVKQLGYSNQKDIKETPSVCYQQIAAVEG